MALTLVSDPKYDSGDSVVSSVAAGLSQLPYIFERRDYITCRGEANAGVMRLIIPIDGVNPDALTEVIVGSILWYNSSDPTLTAAYQVGSIFISGATVEIRCNTSTPYAGAATTGTINLLSGVRQDYKVQIIITQPTTTVALIGQVYNFQTTNVGDLFVNLTEVLKDFLMDRNIRWVDYRIRYNEYYNGSSRAQTNSDPIMAIASKKQILNFGGSNVWDQLLNGVGIWLGWDRQRARNGTGSNLLGGINNTTGGANTWSFTSNEIRRNGLGTGITANYFYFDDNTHNDNDLPSGSFANVTVSCVIFGTSFTSAGQYRLFVRACANGADMATAAGPVIGSVGFNWTSLQAGGRSTTFRLKVQSSIAAKGLMMTIGGTGGAHTSDVVITATRIRSTIGGRVFLTKFKPPINPNTLTDLPKLSGNKVWIGYDRKISLIMDAQFASRTGKAGIQFLENTYDINISSGTPTSVTQYGAVPAVVEFVLTVAELAGRAWHRVRMRSDDGNTLLSEAHHFRIVEEKDQCLNPLYVEWENGLGGVDQWLFENNQNINNSSEEGVLYDRPITVNYEQAFDTVGRIVDEEFQTITMTAEHLTNIELRSLLEIKSSNFVSIWLDPAGTNFVKVRVLDAVETGYNNKERTGHSIQVTLNMPPNFDLYNSDLYNVIQ